MKRYFLLWLLCLGLHAARGQQGALDPSFSGDGQVTVHYFPGVNLNYERASKVLVQQPDGKYIVLVENGGQTLARYNGDGTLDQSFGSGGYVSVNIAAFTAALAPGGKIVVGGYGYNDIPEQWQMAVTRLNSNGTLDAGFGTKGVAFADFTPFGQPYVIYATALAVQSDDKIVAVGNGYYYDGTLGHYAWLAARFVTTGVLDAGFGTGGTMFLELGSGSEVTAIALQPDGKIVLGGTGQDPNIYRLDFTLVRLVNDGTNDGDLDATFGTAGVVAANGFGGNALLSSLAVQPDGKIVAAGYAYLEDGSGITTTDLALARYGDDGTLDATFGTGGVVTTNLQGDEYVYALALGPGSIVVAGERNSDDGTGNRYYDLVVARYLTSDGTLDASFNPGGSPAGTLVSGLAGDDYAYSVAVLSGGSIVVAGEAYNSTAGNQDYLLARYTSSGELDNTFNPAGTPAGMLLSYYSSGLWSQIYALAVQPDGKVVVAGTGEKYDPGSGNYLPVTAVARFNADGTLDGSFGTRGVADVDFTQNNPYIALYVTCIALAPDGKIVLGGLKNQYDEANSRWDGDFALARFTSAGVPDADFGGGDGMVTSNWKLNDYLSALAVQSDGKIVAVGESYDGTVETPDFFLVRYSADGTLDNSFDTDGVVSTDFFGYYDYTVDVAIQSDGKIVVSGRVQNYDAGSDSYFFTFGVARYTSAGVPDNRFGTGGKATASKMDLESGGYLALQSDGKILVGGVYDNPQTGEDILAVVRLISRGTLDGTFGTGGMATANFGVQECYPGLLALQSDGKVLQATSYGVLDASYLGVARYTTAGVLDNSFDTDGKVAHQISPDTYVNNIAWGNGRLYAGGEIPPQGENLAGFLLAFIAGETVQPLPVVSLEDTEVTEGGTAAVTVRVNTSSHPDLTLSYATLDGSASSKGKTPDYKAARGLVTIPNGSDVATISISTFNDAVSEPVAETFTVNLSVKGRAADLVTISDGSATVGIKDQTGEVNKALTVPELPEGGLAVKAFPNPARSSFTLQLQSGNNAPVTLRITDILGRLVEAKAGLAANSTLQLGSNYRPGVYYLHLEQGNEKQTLKLVKEAQ